MPSNLPPGVTDSMLPGNRREDQEVDINLTLTVGEIEDILYELKLQKAKPFIERNQLWYVLENIVEQLEDLLDELELVP